MEMLSKKISLLSLVLCCSLFNLFGSTKKESHRTPKLAVIIIIDQFAYHYIRKLKPFLKYGLKDFLDNGIVFENAFHPHGVPETTPGHHGLCVATCAKDHGAIANDWLDFKGKTISYDIDPDSPLLGTKNTEGKSNKNTRVDGLSDQFVLKQTNDTKNKVFALSLKSHPAISTACRLGKAIWFDSSVGKFISGKAYFDELPNWLVNFNKKHSAEKMLKTAWETAYSQDSRAYKFPYVDNYEFTAYKKPFIGSSVESFYENCAKDCSSTNKYELFVKTPQSSELLFELAKQCVKSNFNEGSDGNMLMWVSVSNLDLLAHFYGPDSKEVIDLIYHLDKQIHQFKFYLEQFVDPKDLLLVLTADHGCAPIPEISCKKGLTLSRRIMADPLVQKMNDFILQKFEIKNIVLDYEPTSFRLNRDALKSLDKAKRKEILQSLKHFLKTQPGIKNAWTCKELIKTTFEPYELENFYKNQIYKRRTGDLICQPEPHCQITKYPTGTSHMTPYDYDTHVPLIIYQKCRFEHKTINKKIWMPQLPVTLAKIFEVSKPSASTFDLLPVF